MLAVEARVAVPETSRRLPRMICIDILPVSQLVTTLGISSVPFLFALETVLKAVFWISATLMLFSFGFSLCTVSPVLCQVSCYYILFHAL